MNRKGMNAVLMVVVTAVVLLMTALSLIFIVQGGLGNFLGTITGKGGEATCVNKRDTFCDLHGSSKWDPTSYSYQNQTCASILSQEGMDYECKTSEWLVNCDKKCKNAGYDVSYMDSCVKDSECSMGKISGIPGITGYDWKEGMCSGSKGCCCVKTS